MREYLNLKGEKIGWLEILELTNKKDGTTRLWECKCKCGNIVYKKSSKLIDAKKQGYNISCGCSKKQEDLVNKIYNDFQIIEFIKVLPKQNRLWKCKCIKCEKEFELTTYQIKNNKNICEIELKKEIEIKHKLHNCFLRIKNRCYNKNYSSYKYYGGRGITICDEWLNDSNIFVEWSLKNGYKLETTDKGYNKLTIDRIDNNKGYSPENCRWVDMRTQANNKINNVFYEYNNKRQTLAQWCRELNLNYKYVNFLIKKQNKSFEEAIKYNKRG